MAPIGNSVLWWSVYIIISTDWLIFNKVIVDSIGIYNHNTCHCSNNENHFQILFKSRRRLVTFTTYTTMCQPLVTLADTGECKSVISWKCGLCKDCVSQIQLSVFLKSYFISFKCPVGSAIQTLEQRSYMSHNWMTTTHWAQGEVLFGVQGAVYVVSLWVLQSHTLSSKDARILMTSLR